MSQRVLGVAVDDANLERYGANEAKLLQIQGHTNARTLRRHIIRDLNTIETMATRVSAWSRTQKSIPQEFEWLLDNRYLLEREAKQAALSLRGVGRLELDVTSGLPYVYTAMSSMTRALQGGVTVARMSMFLKGLQAERALTEKDISILIPCLKTALISVAASCCQEMGVILKGFQSNAANNPFAAERVVLQSMAQGSAAPHGAEELAAVAKTKHAALTLALGNVITSLRLFASADVSRLLQEASVVESLLRQDPSGHYTNMSQSSRQAYRLEVSRLSHRFHMSEQHVASKALTLAQQADIGVSKHVGYFLFQKPLGDKPSTRAGRLYFMAVLGLMFLGMGITLLVTNHVWVALLAAIPLFDLSKTISDFAAVRLKKPTHIPRLRYHDGLPPEGATLCVITTVLSKPEHGKQFAQKLEQYYLSNRDSGDVVSYGLLCDLRDDTEAVSAQDDEVRNAATQAIAALNHRYGARFYLFCRGRQYCASENRYMGWERKRGALTELMRALRQKNNGLQTLVGDVTHLLQTRYVVTLDADTCLSAGTLNPLIGAMLHPLNRPILDDKRRVVAGFGVLQPRVSIDLQSAGRSLFTRLYAGAGGLDPYSGNVSDVYQDYFGTSSFVGKGVVDVDTFLTCLDNRLPENRILSHDLLEGSYLRAGFVGDIEWSDGFPAHVSTWLERGHRWVRGDWQIAAWIGRTVPSTNNSQKQEANPLSSLARFQIFDNLRRSMTPFLFVCYLTAAIAVGGAFDMLAVLSVLALCSHLLISAGQLAARGGASGGQRFHSTIIGGFKGVVYQTVLQLWFLPLQGLWHFHAVLTALWRLHVSQKRLLSWRTAADAEHAAVQSVWGYLRHFYWVAIWGFACLLLTNTSFGVVLGILWLTSAAMAAIISKPIRRKERLSSEDQAFLREQAALIWRYFEELVTADDHFLPPDNWQEQPAAGLARRTSPTNIGLGLLSALAALDLELADSDKVLHFIDRTISTLEQLPKWHGHLYNWYDTATLQPLRPICVSTVDSGNLAGYYVTLREGLLTIGDAAAEDLAHRVNVLYEAMDFRPLYDTQRRLFYIGFDLELNRPTESYYDLLASEARQTSYLAIARGQVPRHHWRRLGRVLATRDRYAGMTSWTGTMFEYFMPHLLMPCPDNSLLYESLKFAVYCHQKRGIERNVPWGISESCFFAFDTSLNYQYKAHGDPRLAYKRGLGKDIVISPYSSFLALMVAPTAAVANLRRLQSMGLEGRYGLCEAADFTPSRLTDNQAFMPVKCYMSHHLGMSLLAIDNILCHNIMQKRFMSDPEMGAYHELLEEKVPQDGVVMKAKGAEVPEKPARSVVSGWERECKGCDITQPYCGVLSNSSYTLFCTDGGLTASQSGTLALTRFEADQTQYGLGWQFFIKQEAHWLGMTAAPVLSPHAQYTTNFDMNAVRWDMVTDTLHTTITARVPRDEHGEQRSLLLRNIGKETQTFTVYAYLEPVLAPRPDYESHPAFSKLFLESSIEGQTIHFKRRARGKQVESHMAITCDASDVVADTSRELALPRGGASSLSMATPTGGTQGAVLDPCALLRLTVTLAPGASRQVTLAMAVAATKEDAISTAIRTLKLGAQAESAGMDGAIRLLALTPAEAHIALDWLTDLVFITESRKRQSFDAEHNQLGQSTLWQWGISGDLPILICMGADAQTERLSRLLRQCRFLSLLGVSFDAVILTHDSGDYRRPQRAHIMETLKSIGCEALLGARGGVHIVDASALDNSQTHLLLSAAALVLDGQKHEHRQALPSPTGVHTPISAFGPYWDAPQPVDTWWDDDNAFCFSIKGTMPRAAWSHTLANQSFGALVRDSGLGHVWRGNARENKLTPWDNDPRALQTSEVIQLSLLGLTVSPFADLDGWEVRITYGFGFVKYEKYVKESVITTHVFVPHNRMSRVITIEVQGADACRISHTCDVILGVDSRHRRHVCTSWDAGRHCLRARNVYNTAFAPQTMVLASQPEPQTYTCDRNAWHMGQYGGQTGAGLDPCFATTVTLTTHGNTLRGVIVLGASLNEPGIDRVTELADWDTAMAALSSTKTWWVSRVRPISVETPSQPLNHYLNGWSLYQVLANRLFARTSLYQCGGAYGFRDQLQDVCAAVYADPRFAYNQILRACAHQFEEGDVQHWWHPSRRIDPHAADRGVRTRCSDDLVWLPYTVCEYIQKTGHADILSRDVPFCSAPPLDADIHDRFDIPRVSSERGSVFEHCRRALDCVLTRGVGQKGLLLIGGCDWNDGFDQVGPQGRGESTWLTWFTAHVLTRFAALCQTQGYDEDAHRYRAAAEGLVYAADSAWDGAWYLRGTFDNGELLGSSQNEECKIDSIAQSFSLWVEGATPERTRTALNSAYHTLVDTDNRLISLFTPPFNTSKQNPGYIKGYLPGVRENGGQYTHAAVWLALGHFLAGDADKGLHLLSLLLPETHDPHAYTVEPHVLAADVYANPSHLGRGGWTHYTGAAAWYYRVAIEQLLGVTLRDGQITLQPSSVTAWQGQPIRINTDTTKELTKGV